MRLNNDGGELYLSELPHTWILDLDGTLVKHNGYKLDGEDSFLPGAREFLAGIAERDMVVILTSRGADMRRRTEAFLRDNGIRFDAIIYDVPYGERILINDDKSSGLPLAIAVRKERDGGIRLNAVIDEERAKRNGEV